MKATLRINTEGTGCEIDIEGVGLWQEDYPSEGMMVLQGDDDEDDYLMVISQEGLVDQTVYRLVPVDTEVEEDAELTPEEDDDDDDEGEGVEEPEPELVH